MVRSAEGHRLRQILEDVDEPEEDVPNANRGAGGIPGVCQEDESGHEDIPDEPEDRDQTQMNRRSSVEYGRAYMQAAYR